MAARGSRLHAEIQFQPDFGFLDNCEFCRSADCRQHVADHRAEVRRHAVLPLEPVTNHSHGNCFHRQFNRSRRVAVKKLHAAVSYWPSKFLSKSQLRWHVHFLTAPCLTAKVLVICYFSFWLTTVVCGGPSRISAQPGCLDRGAALPEIVRVPLGFAVAWTAQFPGSSALPESPV